MAHGLVKGIVYIDIHFRDFYPRMFESQYKMIGAGTGNIYCAGPCGQHLQIRISDPGDIPTGVDLIVY